MKSFKMINIFFFSLSPVMSIIGLYFLFTGEIRIGLTEITTFLVLYLLIAFSICAGYHRYFSHKSFTPKFSLKFFFLLLGPAAFMNSALKWARDHRHHHAYPEDEKMDPYSISKGFLYAHLGWAIHSDEVSSTVSFVQDLESDYWINWQNKWIIPLSILMGLILPIFLGILIGNLAFGLFFLGFFRIFLFHHSIFLINSYCHMFGSRPLKNITAGNSLWIAILTMGDGYHHYHHMLPNDYRAGRKWYNWDPVKWILFCLKKMKLVSALKRQSLFKSLDDQASCS
jgi:stearoyl-CoA desaturase (delta-9 desaturase)